MAMRFGPLGTQGGERRLNVAITRAKVNIKLISSILPSDIDLNRTESEGIRMLRDYLEFAKNGVAALAVSNRKARTDDFVDAVCQFITEHGYKTRKYVGCSGYRIDIAVEHPRAESYYAVGVECDGLSYAAARTARDRDRLRSSVLTKMGWNMYRVWSAEWYKNPEIEGARLLDYIEKKVVESTARLQEIEARKKQLEEERQRKLEQERAEKERVELTRRREEERRQAAEKRKLEQKRRDEQVRRQEQMRLELEQTAAENARRESELRMSARGHAWVGVGAGVNHRVYGPGTITEVDNDRIKVRFDDGGEEKLFVSPSCFERGYLTLRGGQTGTPAKPSGSAAERTRRDCAELLTELRAEGFTLIDHRGTSAILWVLYAPRKAEQFYRIISKYGIPYRLEVRGALATQNRAAWRIMCEQETDIWLPEKKS